MSNGVSSTLRSLALSPKFSMAKNEVFAFSAYGMLHGGDGHFRQGNVMRDVTKLIQNGIPMDSQQLTEIGRWDKRYQVDLDPLPDVPENHYYAWAAPEFWDYEPPLVTYTKPEFMELFEDCCRNYVANHPVRRDEFAEALAANGMSLEPTPDRP